MRAKENYITRQRSELRWRLVIAHAPSRSSDALRMILVLFFRAALAWTRVVRARWNRPQVFVDGHEITIGHLAERRPRHDLQDGAKLWMIVSLARAHEMNELLQGQAGRKSVGIGRQIRGREGSELIPAGKVIQDVRLLRLAIEGISSGEVMRSSVAIVTFGHRVNNVAAQPDKRAILSPQVKGELAQSPVLV